jgi:ABC-type uncharacterized transport system fused permease/ATPase subunit
MPIIINAYHMDVDCYEYTQSNFFVFIILIYFVLTETIIYNIFGRGLVIITYYHRKKSK